LQWRHFAVRRDAQSVCSELAKLRGEAGSVVAELKEIATCKDVNRFAFGRGQISLDALTEIEGRYCEASEDA